MRTAAVLALSLGLMLAACSDTDKTQVREGVDAAVSDLKETGSNIKNDPDVREAGDAIEGAVADGGQALKSVATEAAEAAKIAAAKTRAAAGEAADRTKAATDDAKTDLRKE